MSNVLSNLKPEALWRHFESICNVPHPSKHEDALSNFIVDFAKKINLEVLKDEVGNILIRKAASKGMENMKTVVLQGHIDMVPQKNSDVQHDFLKDPIKPVIDGEWVKAAGTTLGADNGIGVAAAMAVLEDKSLQHGPIEALFTIDEETGMTGAFGLKPNFLKGDILLNLDSEDEGEFFIGCAGGVNTVAQLKYKNENLPINYSAYKIIVTGLKGGHSGIDIILGRGNSNKIMNRLLWNCARDYKLRIATVEGGNLRNAIPREAVATVAVPNALETDFNNFVKNYFIIVKNELGNKEPDFNIEIQKTDTPSNVMDLVSQAAFLNAVYSCPNGVMGMIADMPSVVETSTNLAIVSIKDEIAEIISLQRSSVDSLRDDVCNMMRSAFELAGAEVEHSGAYPGWKPNVDSSILKTAKKVYSDKFGKMPEIKVIHAGLECGLIGDVYPNMEMMSFGPTIRHPHSPDEKVNIPSVEKFWTFLLETLKNIPAK